MQRGDVGRKGPTLRPVRYRSRPPTKGPAERPVLFSPYEPAVPRLFSSRAQGANSLQDRASGRRGKTQFDELVPHAEVRDFLIE